MAKVTITREWQALTDGSNNAVVAASGKVAVAIGSSAPASNEAGIPFTREIFTVGSPAQAWIKSIDPSNGDVEAVIYTY